ncbi:MAG TPA: low molecular weight protein-tyrosine-phosphatase [Lacibacter sp.]|nr:low molecular weight protein-tyrosine-phosphatase [Lacibacter sp.]HMO88885.1 low molecular weight protein-tyrosine-phosphatase [Lacibacter sp.]HMP88003.1 low molecular weight protein-tyrosine-phosphatase [Lacibacter sp.]
MRILMVCLGNICRSPLAEGILQDKAWKAGLSWTVESAGTGSWHAGEPPHRLSQKVARLNQIDISQQRARQLAAEDFVRFDRIYVMDSANYQDARTIAGNNWDERKVDLLLNALYPGENRGVPDPWYGTEAGYHDVFALIAEACDRIVASHITTQGQPL